MMAETSSFLLSIASVPSAPPSANAPMSPMNTEAGYELNQRNEMPEPTMTAQNTASSAPPFTFAMPKYSCRGMPTNFGTPATFTTSAIASVVPPT